ncbi:MAG: AMP-binding protein [Myxococcota bacterium]
MDAPNAPAARHRARAERAEAWRRAGLWDASTLWSRAAAHAAERPDALAVVDRDGARAHTYAAVVDAARALAAHLRARGVEAGHVVSVQLPNQVEAVVAALAVQALGAVLNPLLPGYRRHELEHVFRVARPRAIVTPVTYRGFAYAPLVDEVRAATGVAAWHVAAAGLDGDDATVEAGDASFARACAGAPADAASLGGRADALSEVIFTSGTEAAPKAVLHTEETTNFSVRAAWSDMGLRDDDVVWMPSPVGHSTGFNYGLRMALYHGLPLVLQDRWSADVALALVERFRCSYTLAATTFLQDLVEAARALVPARPLASLRCFGCGGAPVPPDLVTAAREVGIDVRRLYGSTEVLVATWNRADTSLARKRDTDGAPLAHVEVELRDEDGKRCAPGEPGEIFTRGPNTCVGFLDDPEREARTISDDGWVRSGDLATADAQGFVSIVGRRKDIVIRGGLNIAPREVEDLMLAFDEVERVAIVGVPDARLGERCCACVVLRAGAELDLATAVERLRGVGLATHKLPERLERFDALPTTASGKIQKFRIQELLAERAR